jgi:tellurite resistance protein TerC
MMSDHLVNLERMGPVMELLSTFVFSVWLTKPVWMWLAFFAIVITLLVLDLGVLHKGHREIETRESLLLSAFYISLGVVFGAWVWWALGAESGMNYLTGFAVEKALAMDNVFVIAMIFSFFAVPRKYQHRVLFWGILGVIVLRAIMIGVGAAVVSQFSWVLYIFAAFLVATGIKMLVFKEGETDISTNPVLRFMRRRFNVTQEHHGEKFFVKLPDPKAPDSGRSVWFMTPLFMALVLIEIADVIFAVDSVPAIFAITTDPFIVYTSNIFAILGLRALYFALAAMIHRFHYLKTALALVLVFIGSKVFAADLLGIDKVPPVVSLAVTLGLLAGGVIYSLWKTRRQEQAADGAA